MNRILWEWFALVLAIANLPPTIVFIYLAFVWRSHAKRPRARAAFTFLIANTVFLVALRFLAFVFQDQWFLVALTVYGIISGYILVGLAWMGTKVLERRVEEAKLEAVADATTYQKTSDISSALIREFKDLGVTQK